METPLFIAIAVIFALVGFIFALLSAHRRQRAMLNPESIRQLMEDATYRQLSTMSGDLGQRVLEQMQLTQQGVATQNEQTARNISAKLDPVTKQVEELAKHVTALEKAREVAYTEVNAAIATTNATLSKLSTETASLTNALANGKARGSWGELQLRKIVEMVGLEQHISFEEQRQVTDEGSGRPDITISLPGNTVLYIDSKVPMDSYLRALETDDATIRSNELKAHATAVANHVKTMTRRSYQSGKSSLDFTVLFMPVESALSAACEIDPELIEKAARDRVVLAAPTSLIAILTNIATSWQQYHQVNNSEKILETARELHKRLITFSSHLAGVGDNLEKAVKKYNEAIASYDSRVIVKAREIENLGQLSDKVVDINSIEQTPRTLKSENNPESEIA